MAKFHKVGQEEIVYPKMQGYKMGCCDCGLVHTMNFEIVRVVDPTKPMTEDILVDDPQLKVRLTADRDNRSTAAMRREDKKKGGEDYARDLIELRDKLVRTGLWNDVYEYALGKLNGRT